MNWWKLMLIIIFIILLGFAGLIKLILFVNGGIVQSDSIIEKTIEPIPTKTLNIADKITNELNSNYVEKEYTEVMNAILNIDTTTTLLGVKKIDGVLGCTWEDTFKCSDGSTFTVTKRQNKNKDFVLLKVKT
jgi:hypothetical protein